MLSYLEESDLKFQTDHADFAVLFLAFTIELDKC
jgi:hypothetical protein